MKQQDYNARPQNFSRPAGPMMNGPMNAPMTNRPMMAPQRPLMQPQPMMAGGNFAPRPANPQTMMNNGMFGAGNYQQQDTMPGFEGAYNGEAWDSIKLGDVRDKMSQEQAQANIDQMDQFIEQMQGQVDLGVASTGNIDQVTSAINMLVGMLNDPTSWLPTSTPENYVNLITSKGAIVAKNLKVFGDAVAKLK